MYLLIESIIALSIIFKRSVVLFDNFINRGITLCFYRYGLSGIVARMVLLRAIKTRFMPVLLSLWLMGLSLACVSICSMHCEETDESFGWVIQDEIGDSHESECCPIAPTLVSNLPERPSIALQMSADHISVIPATIRTSQTLSNHRNNSFWSSSLDPPFERLCTLRI